MGKVIFRFWLVNVLISICLFILYRFVISETNTAVTGFLENIIAILEIVASLGFSMIYFVAMVLSSFSIFLNHIEKVKNNMALSFLSFSGISALCIVLLAIYICMGIFKYNMILDPLKMLFIFSIIYLSSTIIEFLVFRKVIRKLNFLA